MGLNLQMCCSCAIFMERSQGVNSELQGLGRAGSRYRRPGFNQGGGLAPESDQ